MILQTNKKYVNKSEKRRTRRVYKNNYVFFNHRQTHTSIEQENKLF